MFSKCNLSPSKKTDYKEFVSVKHWKSEAPSLKNKGKKKTKQL